MTALALRKKLQEYMKVADEKKLKAIYTLLQDDIEMGKRISIEQYNQELEEAEKEIEEGNYITHEELEKEMKKW